MTDKATGLGDYPDVLVPLETADARTVLDGKHWRALFGELHRIHDAVAELQKSAARGDNREQP